MILEKLIDLISPQLTALPWVEVYGGMTRIQETVEWVDDATGAQKIKRIPISCAVSGDVQSGKSAQRFRDLIPDGSRKSMLYWEPIQGMTDAGGFRAGASDSQNEGVRLMKGKARIVGWLNSKLLGKTDCNVAADAMMSLLPIFRQDIEYPVATVENSRVRFRVDKEVIRDIKTIFGKYDYQDVQNSFLYPFDYFAMDIKIEYILPLACIPPFELETPIQCIDYTVVVP
jgi:hypothetical protein